MHLGSSLTPVCQWVTIHVDGGYCVQENLFLHCHFTSLSLSWTWSKKDLQEMCRNWGSERSRKHIFYTTFPADAVSLAKLWFPFIFLGRMWSLIQRSQVQLASGFVCLISHVWFQEPLKEAQVCLATQKCCSYFQEKTKKWLSCGVVEIPAQLWLCVQRQTVIFGALTAESVAEHLILFLESWKHCSQNNLSLLSFVINSETEKMERSRSLF